MATFLKPDVELMAHPEGPWLARRGVPVRHVLAIPEALALTFLGYTGSADSAAALLSASLENDEGPRWTAWAVDRWGAYLGEGTSRAPDLEFLRVCRPDGRRVLDVYRRDAAPAAVTWLVTLACNRRCPYCYYAVTAWPAGHAESPPDATFPLVDAVRTVGEMGALGTSDLYLTGGEPLLRRDLPTIVAAAASAGVRAHITTKYAVDRRLAEALAAAGVYEVTVSLDDARRSRADALAGAPGFFDEAGVALRALLDAGVRVFVNAVVTKVNAAHVRALVEHVIGLGVPKLRLSPYSEPYPRRPAAARLVPDRISLHDLVSDLTDEFGHRLALEVGPAETPDGGGPCGDKLLCEVGLRTLDVLPDGRVTRCRYMPGESALVVGDLRHDTLLDIWNSTRLASLSTPDEQAYEGTGCHGCGSFSRCNQRGRCFYTARLAGGRLHAPDARCTREADS